MGRGKVLFLYVSLVTVLLSSALQPQLPCGARIIGCGLDEGFEFQNDCCDCIEFFPTNTSLSAGVLCSALDDTPTCCPCAQTVLSAVLSAGSSGSGSSSASGSSSLGSAQDKIEELVEVFESLRLVFREANNGKNAGKPLPEDLKKERTRLVDKGLRLIEILEEK